MGVTARGLVARRGRFLLTVPAFATGAGGTAILGPNGAGKTTLLLALQGLIDAAGSVDRPQRTAAVFSHPAVLRGTTQFNAAVVVRSVLGIPVADAQERARAALDAVGLGARRGTDARALSTGERQRLALARALACEPEALFLDEPFANIDPDARPELRSLVSAYCARAGCVLVLASSSLADVAALCTEANVLAHGAIVHTGAVTELPAIDNPFVRGLIAESRLSL